MEKRTALITWLKDAHALEKSLEETLERHIDDAKGHPEMRRRMEEHLESTRGHSDTVKECLEILGETPSGIKSYGAEIMGKMQGMTMGDDKILKNSVMDLAAENMEIATYTAIIQLATDLGEDEIANKCSEILSDEEGMARWLHDSLPDAVAAVTS